jgi:hypothetical protein
MMLTGRLGGWAAACGIVLHIRCVQRTVLPCRTLPGTHTHTHTHTRPPPKAPLLPQTQRPAVSGGTHHAAAVCAGRVHVCVCVWGGGGCEEQRVHPPARSTACAADGTPVPPQRTTHPHALKSDRACACVRTCVCVCMYVCAMLGGRA